MNSHLNDTDVDTLQDRYRSQYENQNTLVQNQFMNGNNKFFADEIKNHGHGICGITSSAFSQSYHSPSYSSFHEVLFHLRNTYISVCS